MMKKSKICLTATVIVLLMLVFTSACFAETDLTETTKTGIIGAMDEEVNSLKEALDEKRISTIAGMEFCEGRLDGADVVVVKCSVGKVNAAACTQILIDRFGVGQIINTGVAGSLDAAIDIGDIVVSTEAVQHDMDVTVLGYARGEIPYSGKSVFPADEEMRARAIEAVKLPRPRSMLLKAACPAAISSSPPMSKRIPSFPPSAACAVKWKAPRLRRSAP